MKVFLFLTALMAAALAGEEVTNTHDGVKVEEIMHNDRILNNYYACVMDQGPCTPDGERLKKRVPDVLTNGCKTCTDSQKQDVEKIMKFLKEKKKKMWEAVKSKYDPEGKSSLFNP